MPFENKETSNIWKIVYIDCIEPGELKAAMTRFEVTSPNGETKSIRPTFSMDFVDDYFHIPDDQNIDSNRKKILKNNKELFKTWGLVRVEECISQESLEQEPNITQNDFKWAEKIQKGRLQPSSERYDENIYGYTKKDKIGFK